jgi:hypothetical protein
MAYSSRVKIVRTTAFVGSLKKLGASEADLTRLEEEITANPDTGDVIPGMGGARKARFAMAARGKRGGGRAIYVFVMTVDTAYLLFAYSKKDQSDLSEAQRSAIARVIKELKE